MTKSNYRKKRLPTPYFVVRVSYETGSKSGENGNLREHLPTLLGPCVKLGIVFPFPGKKDELVAGDGDPPQHLEVSHIVLHEGRVDPPFHQVIVSLGLLQVFMNIK